MQYKYVHDMELIRSLHCDINNTCNFRCRFCMNDFSMAGSPSQMSLNNFLEILSLLPLCQHDSCLLSCRYEPTLHPNLAQYMKLIPFDGRNKCSFTTNLYKPLSYDNVSMIFSSNLKSINISLQSKDKELCDYLSGSNNAFNNNNNNNLNIIAKFLHEYRDNGDYYPKINFITMLLNDNYADILPLWLWLSEKLEVNRFIVRTISTWRQGKELYPGYAESQKIKKDIQEIVISKIEKSGLPVCFQDFASYENQGFSSDTSFVPDACGYMKIESDGAIWINNKKTDYNLADEYMPQTILMEFYTSYLKYAQDNNIAFTHIPIIQSNNVQFVIRDIFKIGPLLIVAGKVSRYICNFHDIQLIVEDVNTHRKFFYFINKFSGPFDFNVFSIENQLENYNFITRIAVDEIISNEAGHIYFKIGLCYYDGEFVNMYTYPETYYF